MNLNLNIFKFNKTKINWGDVYLNVYAVTFLIFLFFAWNLQYYFDQSILERLSFRASDLPWLPPGIPKVPLLGVHYFGDHLLCWGWAASNNPFNPLLDVPSSYFPLAIAVYSIFTTLKLGSFASMVVLQLISFLILIYVGIRLSTKNNRILALLFGVFLTLPALGIYDRGNLQGLMTGLIGLSVCFYLSKKADLSAAILGLAIGMKAYPVALLLLPLMNRKWRYLFLSFLFAFVPNVVLITFYGDGFLSNLKGLLTALQLQSSGIPLLSGQSLNSLVVKALMKSCGYDFVKDHLGLLRHFAFFPGLLWILLTGAIVALKKAPTWVVAILSLSSLQLILPVSMFYTTSWAMIAVFYYMYEQENFLGYRAVQKLDENKEYILRLAGGFCLVATALPIPFIFWDMRISEVLSPLSVLLFACLAFFFSVKESKTESRIHLNQGF